MKKTTWLSLLLTAVMLLTCLSLAFADDIGLHNIVTKTYPFYTGKTLDSILDQEFPLYFLDGVDDLPFVEIHDWAELLYFINTDLLSDTGYRLKIEYKGDIVTLEREMSTPWILILETVNSFLKITMLFCTNPTTAR